MKSNYGSTKPLVSVISVCFNEPPSKIRKTLSNIASQSYDRVEQIVVDGGSDKETLEAIREFSNNIIHIVSEPDHGIFDAMNKGIKLSSGSLLIFMNIGDRFRTSHTLADMIHVVIARSEYEFYYGDCLHLALDGQSTFMPAPRATKFYLYDRVICHQTALVRRELFARIGDFDLSYPVQADPEWFLRALDSGAQGLHTGITVCEFELGGISSDWQRGLSDRARIRMQYYNLWERTIYGLSWFTLKIIRRIRTGNFAIPIKLSALIKNRRI